MTNRPAGEGLARGAVRALANRTLLRPVVVQNCSQTLYEAIIGCVRLFRLTADQAWHARATRALRRLMSVQRPDGGFDIGYDFNFGAWHRTGESTSPELVGLIAYGEYAAAFGISPELREAADRAAAWIRRHAFQTRDDRWAIPYGPLSDRRVMVYNGTSFAAAALGTYLGRFRADAELDRIYQGMVAFLADALHTRPGIDGGFWYYNEQERPDLSAEARGKIDFYHQMQQVEVHSLAQMAAPAGGQPALIRSAAAHVAHIASESFPIPYTNSGRFSQQVHVWGFSSCASGFLEAARHAPERTAEYQRVAAGVLDWLIAHSWTGTHFAPIVSRSGHPITRTYMVRSDAWVFSAFALGAAELKRPDLLHIAEECYRGIEAADYSGPESHAQNVRLRVVSATIRLAKAAMGATTDRR